MPFSLSRTGTLPASFFMATFILLAAASSIAEAQPQSQVHAAVFSPDQAFWPGLAAPATSAQRDGLRIAVLPIRIREKDWQERIPCDSCHRLSANGMEFFLENYLAERLRKRFEEAKGHRVDLVAPHLSLLEARKLSLLEYQDSLAFPWDRWFDGYAQSLIYRVRDRMTPPATAQRMDRLGGVLGATHLLLPAKVWFKVDTRARDQHMGHLEWGFHLVFWNVAGGRPEWAMAFKETSRNMDLDASLEPHLDRSLVATWDRMPAELKAYWAAEPR